MSNNQAGKGDKLRKGADLQKYWTNYDNIFKKDKAKDENIVQTNEQSVASK
jgi:hypothetical protein